MRTPAEEIGATRAAGLARAGALAADGDDGAAWRECISPERGGRPPPRARAYVYLSAAFGSSMRL